MKARNVAEGGNLTPLFPPKKHVWDHLSFTKNDLGVLISDHIALDMCKDTSTLDVQLSPSQRNSDIYPRESLAEF